MARKRLTQLFPFLLPLRIWQRNLFYQIGMKFDGNKYSKSFGEKLKYEVCKTKTLMINENSGYDIIYQKNKVENLKIASKTMNHILIYPNETFSFCYLVRNSKKYGKYKDGLILVDGKIVAKKGGGLCHLSNLLHYLFLMSPLTVTERHGHKVKSFPNPDKSSLEGIDATISSGWLDLKVKNETNNIYQIDISFDEEYMYGKILSNSESNVDYKIVNGNLKYVKENENIYECVEVIRVEIDKKTRKEIRKEKKGKKNRKGQPSSGELPAGKKSGDLMPFITFAEDLKVDWDFSRVEVRKGQVYYVPAESAAVRGLVFLRNGLYLGEIRKDRFEPSQALAAALKKSQYRNTIDLPADDPRILHYLKGETIEIEPEEAENSKGWQLLCVSGYPLGWGKLVNGLLKNKFLASWRLS